MSETGQYTSILNLIFKCNNYSESTFKPYSYVTVIIKFKQDHMIPDSQSWQCSYIFSSLEFSIPQCCWLSGWVILSSAPRCSYNMYFSNIIFWKCLTSFWAWIELQHHFLNLSGNASVVQHLKRSYHKKTIFQ